MQCLCGCHKNIGSSSRHTYSLGAHLFTWPIWLISPPALSACLLCFFFKLLALAHAKVDFLTNNMPYTIIDILNIDCLSFAVCPLRPLQYIFFLLRPLTVLKRQTRKALLAINQSIFLRCLCIQSTFHRYLWIYWFCEHCSYISMGLPVL